jgi:hypothetical protein
MKNFIKTRIIDFYNFHDNEYLTFTRKNKNYFIFSRTIDVVFNKAIFLETSTTKDTTITVYKTTKLPDDFFEEVSNCIENHQFLNKVLVLSKITNIDGFKSIKGLEYFAYEKKKAELSTFLYVSRLNYSLILKRTRKPFSSINKSLFSIEKLLKQEIINENDFDKDNQKNKPLLENEKEGSFLIETENFPETDFYHNIEFKSREEKKADSKEKTQFYKKEKDEYKIEEINDLSFPMYTQEEIEEMQQDFAILLPFKKYTFSYGKNKQNKIKWAFSNIKSPFYFPIIHNNLVYYNHFRKIFILL